MVILEVFNSFNVVKNLKNPDLVARQMPPFYTTVLVDHLEKIKKESKNLKKLEIHNIFIKKTCFQRDIVYGDIKI